LGCPFGGSNHFPSLYTSPLLKVMDAVVQFLGEIIQGLGSGGQLKDQLERLLVLLDWWSFFLFGMVMFLCLARERGSFI
jgi:hypothetical protein